MSNWGATDADESKPKYLTTAQKKEVYANSSGWVVEAGSKQTGNGRTGADPEVLVAMSSLTTNLGAATITSIDWVTTAWDASTGGTIQAVVRWNEAVDVVEAGSGLKITIDRTPDGGSAASHTLRYASGTGSNELIFSLAIAGGAPVAAADSFAIPAQSVVKAGATSCKDAGTSTNSELVITAAQVAAAGTIVATA
tara:strand:- start:5893 stop:6480 length:588 start_codon:yes stop_codon:yes gene_type:complete